ncbi:MAG: sulfatase-like hydrolase/transferase, partial [Acidobacteria bacterium]|nr:sulfatase-like hydrolase/transferase [Acidobacteriota bacterium]
DGRGPKALPREWRRKSYYLRRSVTSTLDLLVGRTELPYRRGGVVTDEALTQLDALGHDGAPFFLFVNYMDAHNPYLPPPPFDTRFPGKARAFDWRKYPFGRTAAGQRDSGISEAARAHLISQYDGGIAYEDAEIGRLFAYLQRTGLYDKTLVMVASDHGESFGARGFLGHGESVYQDQVHMTLLVRYPGQREGRVVEQFVSGVDLAPTIAEVTRCDGLRNVQGHSLLSLSDDAQARELLAEAFPPLVRAPAQQRALFSNGLKFVRSTDGSQELYDLKADPGERRNLFNAGEGRSQRLQARLSEWIRLMPSAAKPVPLDPDAIERLRALGYVR